MYRYQLPRVTRCEGMTNAGRAILEDCRERSLIEVSKKVKKAELLELIARINRREDFAYNPKSFLAQFKGIKAQRAAVEKTFHAYITWVK